MLPPPPTSTLFPYTTLFRSSTFVHRFREHRRNDKRSAITGFDGVIDIQPLHWDRGKKDHAVLSDIDVIDPLLRTGADRKSTRLNSSHRCISYAVFCLKKKKK